MDVEQAVAAIEELEESGDLEAATEKAEELARKNPNHPLATLAYASLMVREQLDLVAEDEKTLRNVTSAIERCCDGMKKTLSESVDEESKRLASVAFGLKATLQNLIFGDLQGAVNAYRESISYDESNLDSLFCLATLLDQKLQNGRDAAVLYERILSHDEGHVTTLNNYSAILIEQSSNEADDRAAEMLSRAKELLVRAQSISPGFPAYNLACMISKQLKRTTDPHLRSALFAECESWLRAAVQSGVIPTADTLLEDSDFEHVSKEPWFERIVHEAKQMYRVEFNNGVVRLNPPEGLSCRETNESMETMDDDSSPPVPPTISGTTGWTVWHSSFVTLRFIEDHLDDDLESSEPAYFSAEWWPQKRVLDLSAGLGLVGLACATLGANVVLTDIGQKQIQTLQSNASMNGFQENQVVCTHLAWGNESELRTVVETYGPFDVVFACDLVYIGVRDNIMGLLQATLINLLQLMPTTKIILCFEERSIREEAAFLESLSHHLTVTPLEITESLLRDITKEEEESAGMFAGLELHEMPTLKLCELSARR